MRKFPLTVGRDVGLLLGPLNLTLFLVSNLYQRRTILTGMLVMSDF